MTDEELMQLICGSEKARDTALRYLYKEVDWLSMGVQHLKKNGIAAADAKDDVQEAFIYFDRNVRSGKFDKTKGTLKNYFLGICDGREFVRKRSNKRINKDIETDTMILPMYKNPETEFLDDEIKSVVNRLLNQLDNRCRELLKQYMLSFSMKEIGERLGIQKIGAVTKAAYDCRQKFGELIQNNPSLKHRIFLRFLENKAR